ncbi:MAG: cytidylate kinase-like family protein [Lachnospiraceae bacterium]|jgi:cytidylate kinase|nr:cytidylate kinase-like family protein [Lachnospiraceae bacterium]
MEKQLIISIGREYGSGGHYIAEKLAKAFDLPLYDHNLLDEMFEGKGVDIEKIKRFDEKALFGLTRRVRGGNSAPEIGIAEAQFEYMQKIAKEGKSFVIVGRCAESVLQDYDCLVPVFVLADYDDKVKRIMEVRSFDEKEAKKAILRHDAHRKHYHNYFCKMKWGDSRLYDLSVNSSALGLDETAKYIESFIRAKYQL